VVASVIKSEDDYCSESDPEEERKSDNLNSSSNDDSDVREMAVAPIDMNVAEAALLEPAEEQKLDDSELPQQTVSIDQADQSFFANLSGL